MFTGVTFYTRINVINKNKSHDKYQKIIFIVTFIAKKCFVFVNILCRIRLISKEYHIFSMLCIKSMWNNKRANQYKNKFDNYNSTGAEHLAEKV